MPPQRHTHHCQFQTQQPPIRFTRTCALPRERLPRIRKLVRPLADFGVRISPPSGRNHAPLRKKSTRTHHSNHLRANGARRHPRRRPARHLHSRRSSPRRPRWQNAQQSNHRHPGRKNRPSRARRPDPNPRRRQHHRPHPVHRPPRPHRLSHPHHGQHKRRHRIRRRPPQAVLAIPHHPRHARRKTHSRSRLHRPARRRIRRRHV